MKTDIKVPSVGESITSGIITSWLKQNGDAVKEGEIVCELETDKTTLEIPSPASGILEILFEEEAKVEIEQVIGAISAESQTSEESTPATTEQPAPLTEQKDESKIETPAPVEPKTQAPTPSTPKRTVPQERPRRTPPQSGQRPAATDRRTERVPMTTIRKKTAERLVKAQLTAAYLTTFNEIDMQKVIDIRTHYKLQFQEEHGIKIGFMPFFVKACCQALREYPGVNAQLEGDDIIYQNFYDIGVAISINDGLIVPIIRDADVLHFAEIESAIADFAQRANTKKVQLEELTGGTFTITNGGVFGSLLSTPIPAYPQTAILGMHAIKKRPAVIDDQIVIRPMMYVALSYDHRVIDGRQAIGFLATVKNYIEEPDRLLLEL
jgi:2-oxoglutarate dehydrogenase E2 component (dihydrolipoamide succinyltransferase)